MRYILSIDGGGIRGVLPAKLLAFIEGHTGKPIHQSFDLISGTSTGGIIALGLTCPVPGSDRNYRAQDLVSIYQQRGGEIFSRTFWRSLSTLGGITDEKYSNRGIEHVLKNYFEDQALGNALVPTMITAYDIEKRKPVFFKSWRDKYKDVEVRHIARATSAAPAYFEPALTTIQGEQRPLVDGAVFVNNPAVSAYAEALRLFPNEPIKVLSIGTGHSSKPYRYKDAKGWGKAGWIVPLLDCMFDGVSDAVDYQLCHLLGDHYLRIQGELTPGSDGLDNVSDNNIENLMAQAQNWVDTHADRLRAFLPPSGYGDPSLESNVSKNTQATALSR